MKYLKLYESLDKEIFLIKSLNKIFELSDDFFKDIKIEKKEYRVYYGESFGNYIANFNKKINLKSDSKDIKYMFSKIENISNIKIKFTYSLNYLVEGNYNFDDSNELIDNEILIYNNIKNIINNINLSNKYQNIRYITIDGSREIRFSYDMGLYIDMINNGYKSLNK